MIEKEKVDLIVSVDSDTKQEFEEFCSDMGLTVEAAINIFMKKTIRERKIPFEIGEDSYNVKTARTIQETRAGIGLSKSDVRSMKIKYHQAFEQDCERLECQGYNLNCLHTTIDVLAEDCPKSDKYPYRLLHGKYEGASVIDVMPGWLLIYEVCKFRDEGDVLCLIRTGLYSDLF